MTEQREYRCYGVKKAFIRTYEHMCIQKNERVTETIIFERGVRNYFRVNTTITFDQVFTLMNINIIDYLLGSGSCK